MFVQVAAKPVADLDVLWGIDGQIWAVLWAVFNYKQLRKGVQMSVNC